MKIQVMIRAVDGEGHNVRTLPTISAEHDDPALGDDVVLALERLGDWIEGDDDEDEDEIERYEDSLDRDD